MFDEMEDQKRKEYEEQCARFSALSGHLKGLRDDAIKSRAASGIEQEWLEDEEYFQGIDDANRAERKIKPTSPDGRVTIESKGQKASTRSTVFVNITRPYVNAASAKVADMLLPTDDSNYGMRPTPMPDLIKKAKDEATAATDANGQPILKPVMGEDGSQLMQPHVVNGQPMTDEAGQPILQPAMTQATVADVAKQEMQQAKESCEKANVQIDDWLTQCGYHGEVRQVIEDSARIGTGVLKGPFPEHFRRRAVVRALEGIGIVIKDEIAPKSRCISVWNLYPDGSCGESIHNGKFLFERDDINARQLQDLGKVPGYLKEEIEKVLEEGPKSAFTGVTKRMRGDRPSDKETYEVWYFHGFLSRRDLMDAGYEFGDDDPEEEIEPWQEGAEDLQALYGDDAQDIGAEDEVEKTEADAILPAAEKEEIDENEQFPAIVVMVNDRVIKATLSPLDSGEFPYDVMVWQRRAGHWTGVGVSRQMRTEQDGVNAATRNLMDNAGLAGGPMLVIDRSKLVPADGSWELRPRKVFYTNDNFEGGNVRDAITWIITPSMQQELQAIIQFWMQRAEDATGLPMLLQGQIGRAPDTVGGMTMLNNNASSVLRRIARIFDDLITEPHIGRYYEWLLVHGDDDSMKGDFTIDARGSSALIERDAHAQMIPQLVQASVNHAFGLDPELVMAEMLKSQRFDAEKLKLSDEKKQQMQQAAQAQGPAQDPRLQIAQMNAEARSAEKQAELQAKAEMEQAKRDFEAQQSDMDRALEQYLKDVDVQIAMAEQRGDMDMNNNELKVALARDSAKLKTQIELARQTRAPQVATPAFEPAGRAPDGQAFQR